MFSTGDELSWTFDQCLSNNYTYCRSDIKSFTQCFYLPDIELTFAGYDFRYDPLASNFRKIWLPNTMFLHQGLERVNRFALYLGKLMRKYASIRLPSVSISEANGWDSLLPTSSIRLSRRFTIFLLRYLSMPIWHLTLVVGKQAFICQVSKKEYRAVVGVQFRADFMR